MTSHAKELSCILMVEQEGASSTETGWNGTAVAVSSGDGAADGSTVIDVNLSGGDPDDLVGYWLYCLSSASAVSTRNVGSHRKVLEFNDATGACTVARFPAQTKTGDAFLIVKPPIPYIADDTGGSAAQLQDANRSAKANDYWIGSAFSGGPYLLVDRADAIPTTSLKLITAFTSVGGIFAATLGAVSAAGDSAEVWSSPEEMTGAHIDATVEPVPRGKMGRFEPAPDARGMLVSSGNLEFAFRGPGTGRSGLHTEISRFLGAGFDDQGTTANLTAGAGGTTASVVYGAGSVDVGTLYCTASGDVFLATDADPSPCVPSPSLRVAAVNGTTIQQLRTWWPASAVNYLLAVKQYWGNGICQTCVALAPSWTISAKLHDLIRIKCALQGGDWLEEHSQVDAATLTRAFRAKRPTIAPKALGGGRVVFAGVELALESFTLNLGPGYSRKGCEGAPNGEAGWDLVSVAPTIQLVAKADGDNIRWLDDYKSGDIVYSSSNVRAPLLIQCGARIADPGVLAFWAAAVQVQKITVSDGEGVVTLTADLQVCDHDTDTSGLPPWALGIG